MYWNIVHSSKVVSFVVVEDDLIPKYQNYFFIPCPEGRHTFPTPKVDQIDAFTQIQLILSTGLELNYRESDVGLRGKTSLSDPTFSG